MNFEEWYKKNSFEDYPPNYSRSGWGACKREILKLLEENKELEAVSCRGKRVYKIYGNVIEKIKKEI